MKFKRKTNVKEQFPNEEALERFVCCINTTLYSTKYKELTQKY